MKKYLRCHTENWTAKLGERYEVVREDGRYYFTDGHGIFTKEPDIDGKSYRNWFTLETEEQPRKIDGRKAEIINTGRIYTTYRDFAVKHGYPDAAAESGSADKRKPPRNGDIVTLLVSGPHEWMSAGTLWIVETAAGERHIIGEKGLRIMSEEVADITAFPDESLGGHLREYREVKRKVAVGELVKTTGKSGYEPYEIGEILTVTKRWNTYVCFDEYEIGARDYEEYVVLEPTDVLRISGERLRMVDRKATVGERVIITKNNEDFPHEPYKVGGVYAVCAGGISVGHINRTDEHAFGISAGHYRVLEPVEPSANPTAEPTQDPAPTAEPAQDISALQAQVKALESRVSALEKERVAPDKVAEGPVDKRPPSFSVSPVAPPKSAQQIRDAIVERAKADVKDLIADAYGGTGHRGRLPAVMHIGHITVKFEVDREKRKVTALGYLRHVYDSRPRVIGRAICAPNDVFNAHIGRAISLRRALGLPVPAEYLSVPNPKEPRVGDVVYTACEYGNMTVAAETNVFANAISADTYAMLVEDKTYGKPRIIDDSRESSGEVAA